MDKQQRKHRLQQLLTERHKKMQQQQDENKHQHLYSIYNNCNVTILDMARSEKIEEQMISTFPIASWGRIDWEKVADKIELSKAHIVKVTDVLRERNIDMKGTVHVIAGIFGYPVVETTFEQVISVSEAIYELGPDQWIFSEEQKFVVEFTHDDEIVVGFGG